MTSATARRRRVPIGFAIVVAVGLAATVLVSRIEWPADEVSITLGGVPADTVFLCLVADAHGQPVVMNWYVHMLEAVPMHPDGSTISVPYPERTTEVHLSVQWVDGDRVGVLRRTSAGGWLVSWFGSTKATVTGRLLLIGHGSWTADLGRADETKSMSPDDVRSMGISRALDEK